LSSSGGSLEYDMIFFYLVGRASYCNFCIITNLIHKFLVHSHKLHKIKFLYMFRAQSAHHQEVNDANCTYAASGIVTLCKWPSILCCCR